VKTQAGRELRELVIEWITVHSPQAKGRVARRLGTPRDRLVKAMRKAGIRTGEADKRYMEAQFLPERKRALHGGREHGKWMRIGPA
jgi:hypothetical protein